MKFKILQKKCYIFWNEKSKSTTIKMSGQHLRLASASAKRVKNYWSELVSGPDR